MFNFTRWKTNRIIKKLKSMQVVRLHNQPKDDQLQKEIAYYFDLAKIYTKLVGSKRYPFAQVMVIESYRAAASLDDPEANYQMGLMLLNEAKFRQMIQQEGILASQANLKLCTGLYDEAHAYLLAAEQLGHIVAKRLRGLCLINGWGKEVDKNTGFELIVASIEQEGSWDKVPQLFAAMGLNKPEFFSAIMQRRKDK